MKLSTKIAIAASLAALAALLVGAAAFGSGTPAVRGQACGHVGEHRNNRSGTEYVCEQRTGDPCPVWHAAHPVKGPWPKPSPCLCPSKSPSTSPAASPSTPASTSAHASPSSSKTVPAAASPSGSPRPPAVSSVPVPVADQLPVTGLPTVVFVIAAVGVLLIVGGAVLLIVPLRRRNT